MKIPRTMVGKRVELTWRDPISNLKRLSLRRAPKGRDALGKWTEWGRVDDLSDGVVRICHSFGEDPPGDADPEPEGCWTWVAEELVETIVVLEPERPAIGNVISGAGA